MNESVYYVWCASQTPTKRHKDLESARNEARRLCQMPENHAREFFVLRAVESVQYRTDPFVCRTFSKRG